MNIQVQIGNQPFYQQRQPVYKQFAVGTGINNNEYNAIINSCKNAMLSGSKTMTNDAAKGIQYTIGGNWFVFCCPITNNDFSFSFTNVTGSDFMSFSLDNTRFEVIRV